MPKIILGVMLKQRIDTSTKFQELISEYGCYITTRIGLHVAGEDNCSPSGLVLLEIISGAEDKAIELEGKLKNLKDVVVQKMIF
jgi:metal-responsive CopG/Arc/MetJ family transcriptional regulator